MKLSVIVCTHNPRADHLARTLAALRQQTLPASNWELLVVDNASSPPLELAAPSPIPTRILREPALGLVPARLRGIAEAAGELLVFVDDDNLLAPDFLATAAALAAENPTVGAFGGQIRAEFETPPTPWFAARLDRLAIREFSAPSRSRTANAALGPCGAGLCVRAAVAREYRRNSLNDRRRVALGRAGRQLFSGDDLDLAFTACDLGLEIARFPSLQLIHLIPRERLTLRYFARITRSHARAHFALQALRPLPRASARNNWSARLAFWRWSVIDGILSLFPQRSASR